MGKNLFNDIGKLEYNSYRFNNTTRTQSFRCRPVIDSSGRMVKYNEWSLTVRTYIASLTTTDAEFIQLTELLSAPGGAFRYEGRGLGNPRVNIAGAKDVAWGPKTEIIEAVPVGAGNAIRLTWTIRFNMPACPDGKHDFALMEVAFTVSHNKDKAGFVDRVIAGHLQIPLTHPGPGQLLNDSADAYRRSVIPPKIKGYQREYGPWVLSEDRTRLDFEIRDVENRGEQLPPGVIEAELSESVGSTRVGLRHWQGSMNGTYTLAKGNDGMTAARAFMGYARTRLKDLQDGIKKLPGGDSRGEVIPVSFRATNPNRYGPPIASFELGYTFTLTLKNLLATANLWKPFGKDTWESWTASLTTQQDPYGVVNLKFQPGDDIRVNLCGPSTNTLSTGYLNPSFNPIPISGFQGNTLQFIEQALTESFPKPDPQYSWLKYENSIWVETDDDCFPAKPLPASLVTSASDILGSVKDLVGPAIDAMKLFTMPGSPLSQGAQAIGGGVIDNQQDKDTLRRTEPIIYVYLRGSAVRAGYEIEPPRLIEVGGVKCIPAKRIDHGEGFAKGISYNGGQPLHTAQWNLRYWLPKQPAFVKVPPVPLEGQTT